MIDFLRFRNEGILAIPIVLPTKGPAGYLNWGKWNKAEVSDQEYNKAWSVPHDGIAIMCGTIEVIDVDSKNDPTGNISKAFDDLLRNELGGTYNKLFIETTLSNGVHYWYKTSEQRSSTPLAKYGYNDDERFELGKKDTCLFGVVIETRGFGGYCVCHPTPGYAAIQGDAFSIPLITDDERDLIWMLARSFNSYSEPAIISNPGKSSLRPGDSYSETASVSDVISCLEDAGWRTIRKVGDKVFFNRPGSSSPKQVHADLCISKRTFMNYSTNVDKFQTGRGHSFFAVYAICKHGGDYGAAAKKLAETYKPVDFKPTEQEESDSWAELLKNAFSIAKKPAVDFFFWITQRINPYRTDRHGIAFLGALITISGIEKSRKTTFLGAIIAAALRKKAIPGVERLPFEWQSSGKVLWVDTEQPEMWFWWTIWRIYVQAGMELDDQNSFLALQTKKMMPKERVAAIDMAIERFKPSILVIDGATDCLWDPNDQKESGEFYEKHIKRWTSNGVNVWTVIHESKDESLRGHIGKLLQRKCDAAIGVKSIDESTVEVVMKMTRGQKPDAFTMSAGQNGILYVNEMPAYNFNLGGQNQEVAPVAAAPEEPIPDDLPF